MSNVHDIHQQSRLKQQTERMEDQRLENACDWVAKLDRELSTQELHNLKIWLAADSQNTVALFEVAQLWDKMGALSRLSDLFPQAKAKKSKTPSWIGAIAASIVLALTLGFYQGYHVLQQSPAAVVAIQASYQTGIGQSNTINLPDNSKMVLNTNSFVQIKFTPTARIIELQRGEIHIDVAHDKTRPLSVIAGGEVIQAVGTAFNVQMRDKQVELLVTDGKVLVARHKNSVISRLPKTAMAISKGEKINLDVSGQTRQDVIKVDPIEMAASLSWRKGQLIFRGESLAEAMAEIGRYTDIEFELADDDKLKQIPVAGMFKTGDVTGLLEVLSRNFNISYEKVSDDKIKLKYAG
jgi:transmembrane sensor